MHWSDVILSSQACQRNWDLSKDIPQEHIDLIIESVTKCPSKQNLDFYSVFAITNQDVKEELYSFTPAFPGSDRYNSQILANLLLVFVGKHPSETRTKELERIADVPTKKDMEVIRDDINQAVGIASAFAVLTAQSLGYKTGFCKCFHTSDDVRKILDVHPHRPISLMLGIGHPDESRLRNRDHLTDRRIGLYDKIPIQVDWIK